MSGVNTKEEDIKSRARDWSWDWTRIEVPGVMAGGRDYEISEKQ